MRGYRSGFKSEAIINAAKRLRREMTPAEKALWKVLRSRQLNHLKFRRQYPFDQFILDFYCPAVRLAVELDGSQHGTADGRMYDTERTAYLAGWGINVLRFSNREVLEDTQGVLSELLGIAKLDNR